MERPITVAPHGPPANRDQFEPVVTGKARQGMSGARLLDNGMEPDLPTIQHRCEFLLDVTTLGVVSLLALRSGRASLIEDDERFHLPVDLLGTGHRQ
jgi:hypothetical protein